MTDVRRTSIAKGYAPIQWATWFLCSYVHVFAHDAFTDDTRKLAKDLAHALSFWSLSFARFRQWLWISPSRHSDLRRSYLPGSDDDGGPRHKAQLPRSSVSGFVELQDKYDKRSWNGELSLPPRSALAASTAPHLKGFAAPSPQTMVHA